MRRAVGVHRNERQVDRRLRGGRKFDFGFFRRFAQALQRLIVFAKVDAFGFLKLVGDVIHQAIIEIVAAQVRVAGGRFHFQQTLGDFQHSHVEGAAAEVVHDDRFFFAFAIQAVSDGRRRRLVDDSQHVQAGDFTGVFGGGALRVIEISRHRDDGVADFLAETGFRVGLQLRQNHRRDFFRRIILSVDFDFFARSHVALDRANRAVGVQHRLTLRQIADQTLAAFGERDNRRRGASALGVQQNFRFAALNDRDHRVRRSQVNPHCFWHRCVLSFKMFFENRRREYSRLL